MRRGRRKSPPATRTAIVKASRVLATPCHKAERMVSQIQFRPDHIVLQVGEHLEAQLGAQRAHLAVLRKHVGDQLFQLGLARYADQPGVEFEAKLKKLISNMLPENREMRA